MVETFEYFWVEVEVERAADGSVEWFRTYDFDEEDGERYPYTGIERQDDGVLVFSDTQTSERFDASTGEALSYVRHLEAGTTTYAGRSAWATEKYDSFLRYFARAQIGNLVKDPGMHFAEQWEPDRFERVQDELVGFGPSLERLYAETGDTLSPEGDEPFMFIRYVLSALRGEEGARDAVDAARPRVFEKWGWEPYAGLFERLLG